LPSPRVIQAGLVEKGHLPEDLAMRACGGSGTDRTWA
jgi:hypothetical protein